MPLPRSLTKLQTTDANLNRVQDELLRTLNPVLRAIPPGIGDVPSVTGSRGGNAALASLLTALDAVGLIKDETTP